MTKINEAVKRDILEHFESLEYEGIDNNDNIGKIVYELEAMQNPKEHVLDTCKRLVEGGHFLISNHDMEQFLNYYDVPYNDNVYYCYVNIIASQLYSMYIDYKNTSNIKKSIASQLDRIADELLKNNDVQLSYQKSKDTLHIKKINITKL